MGWTPHKFADCLCDQVRFFPRVVYSLQCTQENLPCWEGGGDPHHLLPGHRVALAAHGRVHQVHHAPLLLRVTQGRRPWREVGGGGHHRQPPASHQDNNFNFTAVSKSSTMSPLLSRGRLLASYWQRSRRLDQMLAPLSPLRRASGLPLGFGVPEQQGLGDQPHTGLRHQLPTSEEAEAAYSQRSLRGRTCSSHWIFTNLFPSSFPNLIFNQVRLGGQVCVRGLWVSHFRPTLATGCAHPLPPNTPICPNPVHRSTPSINRKPAASTLRLLTLSLGVQDKALLTRVDGWKA